VLPEQTFTLNPAFVAGKGFTVTGSLVESLHPFPFVTITLYVVLETGLAVITGVVAPVFHK
jgi:uncharacterized protein YlzI (FlbEa/FlbD family)